MFAVEIDGMVVRCATAEQVAELHAAFARRKSLVKSGSSAPDLPIQMQLPTLTTRRKRASQPSKSDAKEIQWAERGRHVLALLIKNGKAGVLVGDVAKAARLKSAKGSSPLVRAINELLEADADDALIRERGPGGKRWFLSDSFTTLARTVLGANGEVRQ